MIWNGDCKVEGCGRECVDASGFCKKHKEAGQLREQLAAAKEIIKARDEAWLDLHKQLAEEREAQEGNPQEYGDSN